MNFDDAHSAITDHLAGRQIDHIARVGKELELICTDGHAVTLQADVNGDILFKKQSVRIVLPDSFALSIASEM